MGASVRVAIDLDADDLARQMDRRELAELVVELDKAMQDWSFTLELAAHFAKLHKEWHAEAKEINADDSKCEVCAVSK